MTPDPKNIHPPKMSQNAILRHLGGKNFISFRVIFEGGNFWDEGGPTWLPHPVEQ